MLIETIPPRQDASPACSDNVPGATTLSVVVPAFNEAKNIRAAVEAIIAGVAAAAILDYELIVIDDGSTDDTAAILKDLAARNSKIRPVFHPENRGKGAALISGFGQARMDWILFTDADRQIDMQALPRFLEQTGCSDMLVGYREHRSDPLFRRVISKGYNALIGVLFHIALKDAHCPFKLIRRSLIDSLPMQSQGFFIDSELVGLAMQRGSRIREIAVTSCRRQSGVSSLRFGHVSETFRELLAFWLRCRGGRGV